MLFAWIYSYEQRHVYANKAKTEIRHSCLKRRKARHMSVKRARTRQYVLKFPFLKHLKNDTSAPRSARKGPIFPRRCLPDFLGNLGLYGEPPEKSPQIPKGPFCTKNAIAMEMVVFCYRGSISLSIPMRCHISQDSSIQITIAVATYYPRSDLLPVAFLVAQGPLGTRLKDEIGMNCGNKSLAPHFSLSLCLLLVGWFLVVTIAASESREETA